MKKLIAVSLFLGVIFATSDSSASQPIPSQIAWGNKCCDTNPFSGLARFRCYIESPAPIGTGCWCPGVYGIGFVCY